MVFFFSMLALLFGCAPTFVNASIPTDVIISEVAWAGSSTSPADEWIELANVSDHAMDISGWSVAGASSSPIIFPVGSLIETHSTFLISNYANTNTSSVLNTPTQIITTLVSIPNDKLTITLTSSTGSLVDSAGNGGDPFAGTSGGAGSTTDGRFRSMERRDFLIDGKIKDAWTHADTASEFKDGATDFGTPGSFNPSLLAQIITAQPVSTTTSVDTTTINPVPIDPLITQTFTPADITEPEKVCEDIVTDAAIASTITISPSDSVTPIPEPEVISTPVTAPTPIIETPVIISPDQTVLTTVTQIPQGTLRVSEIFPHPATGEFEWIELENISAYPVVTNGWMILDASNAVTVLPNGTVNPGAFLTIENPKGKLNNDGDSVIVKDTNGSIVDAVLYNADFGTVPDVNESLVRVNTTTLTITTTPTKHTSNVVTPRIQNTASNTTTSTTTNTTAIEPVATNVETIIPANPVALTIQGQAQDQPLQTQPVVIIKTIRLSELYPNTGGNDLTDEFIEIENTGDQSVFLDGWMLTDASETKFTFTKDAAIAAHTFKTFLHSETKISLNNSGDTITLTAPDESIVDTKTYDQAKTGFTYARSENIWNWTTTRTPNEPNMVSGNSDPIPTTTPPEPTTSTNTSSPTQSNGTISASLLTIEEVKQRADGTRVKIHGTVTVLPNTFNSQTMYVQDETGGIQIFKSDCLFPTLAEGQSITITGILSHINGEARIKVMNQTSLLAGSLVETIAPTLFTSSDASSVGSLITIAGRVMSRSGNRLALNMNGETMNVDLPKATTAIYKTGSILQVNGILSKNKSGNVVKARSEQDVTQLPKEDPVHVTPTLTTIGEQEPKQTMAIVLILLASLAFVGLKLRPRLYALTQSYGRKTPLRPRT